MRKATQARAQCPPKQIKKDASAYETNIGVEYAEEAVESKIGYLANIKPTTHEDANGNESMALMFFFIQEDGSWFKAIKTYDPYFYVQCDEECIKEIVFQLQKKYQDFITQIEIVQKEDLELVNHLSGKKGKFIKLSFKTSKFLHEVKSDLQPIIEKNKAQRETQEAYDGWYDQEQAATNQQSADQHMSKITDIREYDVAYHIRMMVDHEIRCSFWYDVSLNGPLLKKMTHLPEKLDKADLRIFAFDIETTKQPLKFPDSKFDQIMMISYIVDGKGFLITNRQVVGDDVQDFEYSPKPEYSVNGLFKVFNEPDERCLLIKFFEHIRETKPFIFVTYNGDNFDWPFVQDRAETHGLKMEEECGIYSSSMGEMLGRFAVHIDCYYWVKRDAYLPQGSHGLKAVTKAKLGYDPVELDPELMLPYAMDKPQELAEYSVSDSVATFFLYKKMIHSFIFALCTIIPTYPDEVLRRGSGTLCENLLMAQAFRGNIIFPNKQKEQFEKFYEGKLIDTDTYVGGTVECLQQGIYRSDIPVKFKLQKEGFQKLIDQTDDILKFAIEIEGSQKVEDAENYEEVKAEVVNQLEALRDNCPFIESEPLIYHVDVAAMYPNIILTNRLQPVAIVNEQICAGCVFNKPENNCKRSLDWQWRGETFPLSKREFQQVKDQLNYEIESKKMDKEKRSTYANEETLSFEDKLRTRVKEYCQRVYKQVHIKKLELKSDTVCMRENPFYVDTVRAFRDRRYEFKRLVKVWVNNFKEAKGEGDNEKSVLAEDRMALYDSLQLAHKIILNSFYGYVMKKGARWYSMEMAAQVTHTGGSIITQSRQLFDQIGMPLELDTDGIWTLLPKGFPEGFEFKMKNGKKLGFDFPCTMCNNLIFGPFGNDQYQTLVDSKSLKPEYETRHEMSIFFELDGPYKCMLIPASTEEGKMLKKRYAVFNHAGKMTEVKGFELKRRGELKIIKIFQEEVFSQFLEGSSLQECYDACGEVGERWYDILDSKGEYIDDQELIEYIGEEKVLSKSLSEYGSKKGTSITCAKRLAEFLGQDALKEGSLNVKFIISKMPMDEKVASRAIPTAIFDTDKPIKEKFLKKWLKDSNMTSFDLRSILDWDYYKERLGGAIQKIITIPAALQNCMNPIPKIAYPQWLHKRIKIQEDKFKQKDMKHFFQVAPKMLKDVEDLATMGVVSETKHQIMQKKKIDTEQVNKSKEKYSKIVECPEPADNFNEWQKYQKQNWRKIRQNFKQNKQIVHADVKPTATLAKGLGAYIRNMDEVILNSNWHIVSIEQTQENGIMKLWAITDNSNMFPIKLRVPRTIYINSKIESQDKDFRKVRDRILPRNRQTHLLYEWETSEEVFLDRFHNINYNYLLNSNIEGIYETKMPLKFKAVTEIGCIVRPRKNKIPSHEQAQGRIYQMNELELKRPDEEKAYLPSESYDKIYMIHHSSGNRHILCMFQCNTKICYVVVVHNAPKNRAIEIPSWKSLFSQTLEELDQHLSEQDQDKVTDEDFSEWDIQHLGHFNDLTAGLKLIDKQFLDYKQKNKQATVVFFQSDTKNERIQTLGLRTMINDFPVVRYAMNPNFSYFPSVDWIRFAFKNISISFVLAGENLKERINKARYAYTPLGNLEEDSALAAIDTLYARNLSKNRHVLWYSNTSLPDLGGHEDQDFRSYFQDETQNPEWIKKGFYRGYTIQLKMRNLAINTILQSDFLKEFQEATMNAQQTSVVSAQDKNKPEQNTMTTTQFDTDLDEFVACSAAFARLKDLVQVWLHDAIEKNDLQAINLIENVYRWLSSPKTSKMYDPLLHQLVHKLMTKNFYLLLRRFKQLGCKIIYASFHEIWVYTEKRTFSDAQSQVDFVIEDIKQKDLFQYCDIDMVEAWKILLFKDRYNYGGIKESTAEDKYFDKWDIVKHLPEVTRKAFRITTGEYIYKVYKYNKELDKKRAAGLLTDQEAEDQLIAQSLLADQKDTLNMDKEDLLDIVDDVKKEPDHDYIAKLITQHFSQKLFLDVSDFNLKKTKEEIYADEVISDNDEDDYGQEEVYDDMLEEYSEEFEDNAKKGKKRGQVNAHVEARRKREEERKRKERQMWEFPQKIGSHYRYVNPALEFTKFITNHVFALDEAFFLEAQQIKSNLLQMIRCKQFSKEAQEGIEPSLVFVMPDVICEKCQDCTDIDLCRDDFLNEEYEGQAADGQEQEKVIGNWSCKNPACNHEMNKFDIEKRLLDMVNRRLISYQMQDLKCKQCKMVKNSIISQYCECTGAYIETQGNQAPEKLRNQNLLNPNTDISVFMSLVRNFATYHEMSLLTNTTEQIIQIL